ncbi:hypothetical protein EYF80_001892 [Liparis tanakae]|uniref:Uncharacterized protein n=1 Tax=Liparis tanakae TaxID=230148 RepID=A0A4Z2JE40_9TELE|nr:hypothetical protein EYF80_001892 [Liparis tanakae]
MYSCHWRVNGLFKKICRSFAIQAPHTAALTPRDKEAMQDAAWSKIPAIFQPVFLLPSLGTAAAIPKPTCRTDSLENQSGHTCFTVNSFEKRDSCCCNGVGGAWPEFKIMTEVLRKKEERVKTGYTQENQVLVELQDSPQLRVIVHHPLQGVCAHYGAR